MMSIPHTCFLKVKKVLEKLLEPVFSGFADRADFRGLITGTEITTDSAPPDRERQGQHWCGEHGLH